MQALARGLAMKAPEKPVLLAIANYSDAQGYCYPGIDTLAFDTGYSEPTVKRARKRLEDEGWLLKKRRYSTSNLYRLNLAKLEVAQVDRKEASDFVGELEFNESAGQDQSDHSDLSGQPAGSQSDHSDPSSQITVISPRDQSDPLTSSKPVTNQPPVIREADSPQRRDAGWLDEPPTQPSPGTRLLTHLPVTCRPDLRAITRLAPKLDVLLADGEWTEDRLRRQLTGGIDSAHNPAGVVVRRIEGLPLPKGTAAPSKPHWCGECDERTRQRENEQGLPFRCPQCHPKAVVLDAPAS
jgi:DNA-binding MarR family transcriptional regulator